MDKFFSCCDGTIEDESEAVKANEKGDLSIKWFELALSDYRRRHTNGFKVIHNLCIWPLFISAMTILAASTSKLFDMPIPFKGSQCYTIPESIEVNLCTILTLVFSVELILPLSRSISPLNLTLYYFPCYSQVFYAMVELPGAAGCIAAALVIASYNFVLHLNEVIKTDDLLKYATIVHISCWGIKILIRFIQEGRAPRISLTGLLETLMAPLFFIVESLFTVDYRAGLKKRTGY